MEERLEEARGVEARAAHKGVLSPVVAAAAAEGRASPGHRRLCLVFAFFLVTSSSPLGEISYSVSRQPLSPPRLTHHEVNICHQLVVEHH